MSFSKCLIISILTATRAVTFSVIAYCFALSPFQSSPPQGRCHSPLLHTVSPSPDFNPHRHKGGDISRSHVDIRIIKISILTATRAVTLLHLLNPSQEIPISILTATRAVTPGCLAEMWSNQISILTATRAVTRRLLRLWFFHFLFQSSPPQGR